MFSLMLVCLSVCLLTRLVKKLWSNFHETFFSALTLLVRHGVLIPCL